MTYKLTEKQEQDALLPYAVDSISEDTAWELSYSNRFEQTLEFHDCMGLPNGDDWSKIPAVEEISLRAKLHLEELLELFEAMGVSLDKNEEGVYISSIDQSKYDPIEVADGLADQIVICNGTAAQFGIPMNWVEDEVYSSNMSKLDENGNPVINTCSAEDCKNCEGGCSNLIDPSKPKGKLLKPATYVPANIARLYKDYCDDKESDQSF